MSLCRSKFPMLLKMRPQISHGWMYLRGDASLRAGGNSRALAPSPFLTQGSQKRGYVEAAGHEHCSLQYGLNRAPLKIHRLES